MTTIDSTTSVGYQFVHQYYHYINTDTKKVHCFFKKDSTYIHGYENGLSHVATGQQEVNDLITSGNFQGCRVRITQYDTIPSINDSILVMVIGILFNPNSTTQKFSQSFVLAKEADRKYYIASTAFRFHDLSENAYVVYGTVPMNQMIQMPTEVPKEESRQEETTKPAETSAPQETAKAVEPEPAQPVQPTPVQPTPVQPTPVQQPAPQPVQQPTPQPVQPTPQPAQQPTPQPVQQPTPQPEKNKPKPQAQAQPQPQPQSQSQPQHSAPKAPNTWASKAAGGTSKWVGTAVSQTKGVVVESKDETKITERETKVTKQRSQGPDYSAYIANFEPLSEEELKNQFSVFGEVKSVAKLQGAKPGAFVNFLASDALEKAVAATVLEVNGKAIRIERKKSKSTNSSRQ